MTTAKMELADKLRNLMEESMFGGYVTIPHRIAHDIEVALRASAPGAAVAVREAAAEAIYNLMPYDSIGKKPKWTPGGNSLKQFEARRYAEAALASLPKAQEPQEDDSQLPTAADVRGILGPPPADVPAGVVREDELYKLRDLIASHFDCQKDCPQSPSGCGCSLTAARAVLAHTRPERCAPTSSAPVDSTPAQRLPE